MAVLLHEVWQEPDGKTGVCLAGPDGEDFRHSLAPGARLIHHFEAGSHFEAMTCYYRFEQRGAYTTAHASDHAPYPDAWAARQRTGATR